MNQSKPQGLEPPGPGVADRRNDIGTGSRPGAAMQSRAALVTRLRQLERENEELRRANRILSHAAVYFGSPGSPRNKA